MSQSSFLLFENKGSNCNENLKVSNETSNTTMTYKKCECYHCYQQEQQQQKRGEGPGTIVMNLVINNRKAAKGRPYVIGMSFGQLHPKAKALHSPGNYQSIPHRLQIAEGRD